MADETNIPDDFAVLFVTGLSGDEDEIREIFKEAGTISNIRLLPQKEEQSTRAGIITMSSGPEAKAAMEMLKFKQMPSCDKKMRLNWDSRSLERRQQNGGGGGGFGRSAGVGGFGASSGGGGGGGFGSGGGGGKKFDSGGTDVNAPFIHCLRTLLPSKINRNGQDVVVGYLFEDSQTGSAPVETGGNASGGFGGGSSSFGKKADDTEKTGGFGGGGGFGRKTDDTSGGGSRGFGQKDSDATEATAEIHVSTTGRRKGDIMPEIQVEPNALGATGKPRDSYFARRKTIDANVSVNETAPFHPRIEAPKEGETMPKFEPTLLQSSSLTQRLRARRAGSGSVPPAGIEELDIFKPAKFLNSLHKPATVDESLLIKVNSVFQDGTCTFWVSDADKHYSASSATTKLAEEMKTFYASSTKKDFSPTDEQPVAVCKAGIWYRGKFLKYVNANTARVFCVDLGEEHDIEKTQIQPLDKRFGQEPMLSVTAKIESLSPPLDQASIEDLVSLLTMRAANEEGVNALVNTLNPPSVFLTMNQNDIALLLRQKKKQREGFKPSIGTILLVDPNGIVFIIDSKSRKELEDLQTAIGEAANKNLPADLAVDKVNAVFFETDTAYYRGLIYTVNGAKYDVEFIDFGNTVQVNGSNLRGLPPTLAEQTSPTTAGQLSGFEGDGMLAKNPAVLKQLTDLVEVTTLYEVLEEKGGAAIMRIWDDKDQLIGGSAASVQKKSGNKVNGVKRHYTMDDLHYKQEYKAGQKIPVIISYVTDPELMHLTHGTEITINAELDQLQSNLIECEKLPTLTKTPEVGSLVCARFSEDKQWYRAVVDQILPEGGQAFVLYIDFGNHEIVPLSDMCDIKEEWVKVPRALIPVALDGIRAAGSEFSEKQIEDARNMLLSKEGTLTITGCAQDSDNLFFGDISLNDPKKSAGQMLIAAGLVVAN